MSPWWLLLLVAPGRSLLVLPARWPASCAPARPCNLQMATEHHEEEENTGRKRLGILWPRLRSRVSELDDDAPLGENVEVITKEIDAVLASRRKRHAPRGCSCKQMPQ